MKREYPEHPIVGVSAVIFVDKSVLLVRRKQEPAKGQWSLPGGAVELGEGILEALARELLEELSSVMVDASICGLGQAAPNPMKCVIKYFPNEL